MGENQILAAAVRFALYRLTRQEGRNPQTKKRYVAWRPSRLTGDADQTGLVADSWPVSEFAPAAILARWGEGRYRADFYDASGSKVQQFSILMATPPDARTSTALAPKTEDAAAAPAFRPRGGTSFMDYLAYFAERDDRARERARLEAESAAQRNREFWAKLQANRAQLTGLLARKPDNTAAVAFDGECFRREFDVMLKKEVRTFERRLGDLLPGGRKASSKGRSTSASWTAGARTRAR